MVRIEPWLQFAKSAENMEKWKKIAKLRHKDIKSKAAKVQARQETEKKSSKKKRAIQCFRWPAARPGLPSICELLHCGHGALKINYVGLL